MILKYIKSKNEFFLPKYQVYFSKVHKHHDIPERIDQIISGLKKGGSLELDIQKYNSSINLSSIHTKSYIHFLQQLGDDQEIPYFFGKSDNCHFKDTITPLFSSAFVAAKKNISLIESTLDQISKNDIFYYVLRPPGHHASKNSACGYCYLNNIAYAAKKLMGKKYKISILDIDFDHGNGTQEIFYDNELLFVSLHINPENEFPYYSGFESEIGTGKGYGRNINIPLKKDTDEKTYTHFLNKGLEKILKDNSDILLISLGYDIAKKDDGFNISENYFVNIAKILNQFSNPKIIFQEGGYNLQLLKNASENLTKGFTD